VLLRASGEHTGDDYALESIHGVAHGGIPHEAELLAFADAFYADDGGVLERARRTLHAAVGDAAFVDAAGIVGIFDAVVRIADATGTPLEDYKLEVSEDLRADLGINDFPSAREL
jgi:hypothetical protein